MDIHSQLEDPTSINDSQNPNVVSAINQYGLTTFDLLTYANSANRQAASNTLAKRLGRPIREIEDFLDSLKEQFVGSIKPNPLPNDYDRGSRNLMPTGLATLDQQLGGGIPVGEITEVFGSSGSGKSQFLLQLSIQWQKQAKSNTKCVYISTESPLETRRLESIVNAVSGTSLKNVLYIYCPDLESQDHIMQTQLPVLLKQDPEIGLVIVDSISHHLRREDAITNVSYLRTKIKSQEEDLLSLHEYGSVKKRLDAQHDSFFKSNQSYKNFTARTLYSIELNRQLQMLARKHSLAVVLANQVSDAFDSEDNDMINDNLFDSLDYNSQMAFIAGWDKRAMTKYNNQFQQLTADDIHAEIMSTLQNTKRRRVVGNDNQVEEFDPRNRNTNSLSDLQSELIEKLHREVNCTTKRYVPALGYPWSRRICTRILLMKTYRPNVQLPEAVDPETGLTYSELCEGYNIPDNDTELDQQIKKRSVSSNHQTTLADLVKEWKIERFIKVVATSNGSHLHMKDDSIEKIPFSVEEYGIREA